MDKTEVRSDLSKKNLIISNGTNGLKEKTELIIKVSKEAPAPRRDYHTLKLYQKYIEWTCWKICRGPRSKPVLTVHELPGLVNDLALQAELTVIFGESTTHLIKNVAKGQWTLTSMPSTIIYKICLYINVCDILTLSQVCKRLSEECSKNELWRTICKRQWKILLDVDIEKANLIGWKKIYLEKMKIFRPGAPNQKANLKDSTIKGSSMSEILTETDRKTLIKSNQSTRKHIREIKSGVSVRSNFEVFEKDFRASSISTGKTTDRSFISNKGKTYSRKNETSGNILRSPTVNSNKFLQHSSQSVINFHSQSESLHGSERIRKNKSPRTTKKTFTSIRTRSTTSQSIQPMDDHSKLKNQLVRPISGKSTNSKK